MSDVNVTFSADILTPVHPVYTLDLRCEIVHSQTNVKTSQSSGSECGLMSVKVMFNTGASDRFIENDNPQKTRFCSAPWLVTCVVLVTNISVYIRIYVFLFCIHIKKYELFYMV